MFKGHIYENDSHLQMSEVAPCQSTYSELPKKQVGDTCKEILFPPLFAKCNINKINFQ